MIRFKILLVVFGLFLAKFSFAQNEKSATPNVITKPIFIKGTWQNLLDTAQAKKKIILVQCTAEWCLPCKQMEKFTFTDVAFAQYAACNLLCYKLDASGFDDINLLNEFKVEKYPTILFINIKGKEIKRLVGFQSAKNLITESEKILHPKKYILPPKNLRPKSVKK